MARTLEMFEKPRKPHQWLMHVCDADSPGEGEQHVQYRCNKCGHESEWQTAVSVTAAKRGIPCPKCNPQPDGLGKPCIGDCKCDAAAAKDALSYDDYLIQLVKLQRQCKRSGDAG